MHKYLFSLFLVGLLCGGVVSAAGVAPAGSYTEWTQTAILEPLAIKVPTVVEYAFLPGSIPVAAIIVDETEQRMVQSLTSAHRVRDLSVTWKAGDKETLLPELVDLRPDTFMDFPYQDGASTHTATLLLSATKPITSNRFTFMIADLGVAPEEVSVRILDRGQWTVVLNKARVSGNAVVFPMRTATQWEITFTYRQPLRVTEVALSGDDATGEPYATIRHLAYPGHQYRVYVAPTYIPVAIENQSDLYTNRGIKMSTQVIALMPNPQYVEPDQDQDGLSDSNDNCPFVHNSDQTDQDTNGTGDACDDFDRDGYINTTDNCPDIPNRVQEDKDGDGRGDACDDYDERFTERNTWVPWVGIGGAGIVLIVLFFLMWKRQPLLDEDADSDTIAQ